MGFVGYVEHVLVVETEIKKRKVDVTRPAFLAEKKEHHVVVNPRRKLHHPRSLDKIAQRDAVLSKVDAHTVNKPRRRLGAHVRWGQLLADLSVAV